MKPGETPNIVIANEDFRKLTLRLRRVGFRGLLASWLISDWS